MTAMRLHYRYNAVLPRPLSSTCSTVVNRHQYRVCGSKGVTDEFPVKLVDALVLIALRFEFLDAQIGRQGLSQTPHFAHGVCLGPCRRDVGGG